VPNNEIEKLSKIKERKRKINSTTGKYCLTAFMWMVILRDFIHKRNNLDSPA